MRLLVVSETSQGASFTLEEGDNLLGRWDPNSGAFPEIDVEDVDPDARVSRKHAIVDCQGNRAWLRDLGSLNGTSLNGVRLKETEVVELAHGDSIQIGKLTLRFEQQVGVSLGPISQPTRAGD